MKIGVVGLGKLGYPVACAIASRGHLVIGYDIDLEKMTHNRTEKEVGATGCEDFSAWLTQDIRDRVTFGTLRSVREESDIVFVAVQTPHDPEYEGITPIPGKAKDFDYTHLKAAFHSLRGARRIVIISTVLPGTCARLFPGIVYNPFFIAMGTVVPDFLNPEFVLLGGTVDPAINSFYSSITEAHRRWMSIESAELVKVAYNTMISSKIAFANVMMEICHRIPGADVDAVMNALKSADRRLTSPAYLTGGMGDGGGCHPRDNIAMMKLAEDLDLHADPFAYAMRARENQARWLAGLVRSNDRPWFLLGPEFKPETNLTTGSHALLVKHYLPGMEIVETPYVPGTYLIGCKHARYRDLKFPAGSTVIDPHRYIPDQPGVKVIRLGEWSR